MFMYKKIICIIIVLFILVSGIFLWQKTENIISDIDLFEASLVEIPKSELNGVIKEDEIIIEDFAGQVFEDELSEQVEQKVKTKQEIENINETRSHTILSEEEIEEKIKEISEKVDEISKKVDELVESNQKQEFVLAKTIEDNDEDMDEDKEEDEEEKEKKTEEAVILCEKKFGNIPARNKVIINEVAWMGTETSSNDEWIELKNFTNKEINLEGWQLIDEKQQIKVVFTAEEAIPVDGFILLERTDNETVPDIQADLIYTGALSNSDELLYLFDENCQLQDEVLADTDWPAGDNSEKRTMERSRDLAWHTYNGSDRKGIFGTPKAVNSFTTVIFNGGGGGSSSSSDPEPEPEIQYCSQENLSLATSSPIIFNEIAWMGTATSSSNEWIELKNVSDQEISLNGWQILDKNEQIKIAFIEEEVILANSFYFLERTDDDSVPNIVADLIYVGGLNNEDETLRLFDANCNLIDEIQATSTWPAGDNSEKRTMERNQDLDGWHTYLGEINQGIMGTPKQENSKPEEEEEEEEEDLPLAENIVISEIQLANNEFIELYNPTEEDINISNWYFSYFSSARDWDNPWRNKCFSDIIISAKSYFLIGLEGYPEQEGNPNSDWQVYQTSQLGNQSGSVAIFSCNPKDATSSEIVLVCKIDAVGWGDVIVKETTSINPAPENKSLIRIKNKDSNYVDSNNNFQDFEIQDIISPTNSKGEINIQGISPPINIDIVDD